MITPGPESFDQTQLDHPSVEAAIGNLPDEAARTELVGALGAQGIVVADLKAHDTGEIAAAADAIRDYRINNVAQAAFLSDTLQPEQKRAIATRLIAAISNMKPEERDLIETNARSAIRSHDTQGEEDSDVVIARRLYTAQSVRRRRVLY